MNWIKVEDRLPEPYNRLVAETDTVILHTVDIDDKEHVIYSLGSYNYNMNAWRYDFGDEIVEEIVTHWMPLPEPPKD